MVRCTNILPLQLTNYQTGGQYKPEELGKTENFPETITSFTPSNNEEEKNKPDDFNEQKFINEEFIPLELAINDYLKETV